MVDYTKEDVAGYECKHAIYAVSDSSSDDAVIVKEVVHLKDGRKIPNMRILRNYKRDFWITKEGFRNHKDKKEWEERSKLQKFSTTQRKLNKSIGNALGRPGMQGSLRQLARSPYLYGCDATTPVLVKNRYREQWPEYIQANTLAVLDIETDTLNTVGDEIGEIISISLTFKDRAILVYTKQFLGTLQNPIEKTHKLFDEYLGEYKRARNINLDVVIAEDSVDAIRLILEKAHDWKPDIIGIWNMNFDLREIVKGLEKAGIDPGSVFSAPEVPDEFKFYKYQEGAAQKITASGKTMAVHPADRWHVAETPASFYFLDCMCLYKKVRIAGGNEPKYSLDYILDLNLGIRKLAFDDILAAEAPTLRSGSLDWHRFMQANYKIEYGIYNLFDCISVELLDEKTGDSKSTVSILTEHSEYSRFPSQPRRTVDDLHFFCQENDLIIGTTSDTMEDELDKSVLSMVDWIPNWT